MDGMGHGHGLGVHALHEHVTNSRGGKDQFLLTASPQGSEKII